MKLIIAGGRYFEDKVLAVNSFMELISEVNYTIKPTVTQTKTITEQNNDTKSIVVRGNPFTEIVIDGTTSDCCRGEFVANFYHMPVKRFVPDWDTLGKRADGLPSEYVRNVEMSEYADALLAFWDKKSKGSENMIKVANLKGLLVKTILY